MKIMKSVEYKHLLVSLKTDNRKNQKKTEIKKTKELEVEIKKTKT